MPFNPDEFLNSGPKPEFDPDAFLSAGAPEESPEMGLVESMTRGALDYGAPIAGMVAGGVLGSPGNVPGAVAGAGLGLAAGKELAGLGKHYIFGDDLPSTKPADQALRVAENVAEGSAGHMAGPVTGAVLSKGASALKSGVSPVTDRVMGFIKELATKRKIAAPTPEVLKESAPAVEGYVGNAIPVPEAPIAPPAPTPFTAGGLVAKGLDKMQSVGESMNAGFSGSVPGRIARHAIPGSQKLADVLQTTPEVVRGGAQMTLKTIEALGPRLGKYQGILRSAAERGGSAIATTSFLLQQQDPEFQKLMGDLREEGE